MYLETHTNTEREREREREREIEDRGHKYESRGSTYEGSKRGKQRVNKVIIF